MKYKLTPPAAEVKTPISTASQEVAALRDLTAKQLVEKARKDFSQHLNLDNGKTWLLRKVGYLIQEKHVGLNETTAHRAAELDKQETITEMKAEDMKAELLKAAKHKEPAKEKSAKEKSAKEKSAKENSEGGFRAGSMNAQMFMLLKNGCTMKELNAISEKRAKGFLKWIQKPVGTPGVAESRSAVIEEHNGQLIIKSIGANNELNHRA